MPENKFQRWLKPGAVLFLVMTSLYVAKDALLRAQVFQGAGLSGGMGTASSELSGSGIRTDSNFQDVIADVIDFVLPYTAIAAFVAFVAAGFVFILGFGSDTAHQRARKLMIGGAIGIIVVIFSYALVQLVIDFAS